MAIITAPTTTGGTTAAADTYYYDLFVGTLTPATGAVAWRYPAAGNWTISSDSAVFTGTASDRSFLQRIENTSPADTFVFRSVLPANALYNQYGDPLWDSWPDIREVGPANVFVDIVKDSSGNYRYDLTGEFADNTTTAAPRSFSLKGLALDGNFDVIRTETYASTISGTNQVANATPLYVSEIDINTNAAFTGFVTQGQQSVWNVPWVFEANLEEKDITVWVRDLVSLGGNAQPDSQFLEYYNQPDGLPLTRHTEIDQAVNRMVAESFGGRNIYSWDTIDVDLRIEENNFSGLSGPSVGRTQTEGSSDSATLNSLAPDAYWLLFDGVVQTVPTGSNPPPSSTVNVDYELVLDPHMTGTRAIQLNANSSSSSSFESLDDSGEDFVLYSTLGFKRDGSYGIVSASTDRVDNFAQGTDRLDVRLYVENNTAMNGSNTADNVAEVTRYNNSGYAGRDVIYGAEMFGLTPGNDNVTIEQFSSTEANRTEQQNHIHVLGLTGRDDIFIENAGGGSATLDPSERKWAIDTLGLSLSTFVEDRVGATLNLTNGIETRRITLTPSADGRVSSDGSGGTAFRSSYSEGTAGIFAMNDGAGNGETLTLDQGVYLPNLLVNGTRFTDRYFITDDGAGGRIGQLEMVGSHGSDWIVVRDAANPREDYGLIDLTPSIENDSEYSKPLAIALNYEDALYNYIPAAVGNPSKGLQAFSNVVFEGAATGLDGFSYGGQRILDDVNLKLTEKNDYFEFIFDTLQTDDYTITLGEGADSAYIQLPWNLRYSAGEPSAITAPEAVKQEIFTKDPSLLQTTPVGENSFNIILGGSDGPTAFSGWSDWDSDKLELDLSKLLNVVGEPIMYGPYTQRSYLERVNGIVNDINIQGFGYQDQLSLVGAKVYIDNNQNVNSYVGLSGLALDGYQFYARTDGAQELKIYSLMGQPSGSAVLPWVDPAPAGDTDPALTQGGSDPTPVESAFGLEVLSINLLNGGPGWTPQTLLSQVSNSEDRTVQQFAEVRMTDGRDYAVLHEDSGLAGPGIGVYNFKGGDDDVVLYKGDIDVALGAGDDYARIFGTGGFQTVIGNAGFDGLSLTGNKSEWTITTLTTTQAAQMLADKYGVATPTNISGTTARQIGDFGIEQDAAGLNVVYLAKYEGGGVNNSDSHLYDHLDQTVMFQVEQIDFNDQSVGSEALVPSYDYVLDMAVDKTAQSYYGRRLTEDSITIRTDTSGVTSALKNVRLWLDTKTVSETNLNGSMLDGSHVNNILATHIKSNTASLNSTAVHKFVDIEKITVTDGSAGNTFTFRIVGSNGYESLESAQSDAHFGDMLFIAEKFEQYINNDPRQGVNKTSSGDGLSDITINSGLGVVFEAAPTSGQAHNVTISEALAPAQFALPQTMGGPFLAKNVLGLELNPEFGSRVTFLLGDNAVNVQGSELNDIIIGNSAANVIRGGGGQDVLYGGSGRDTLLGQAGSDLLIGSDADYLNGGTGDDQLIAQDSRRSGTTFDTQVLVGGSGDDQIYLAKNNGQVNVFLGSGQDQVMVAEDWFKSFAGIPKDSSGEIRTPITTVTKTAASDPVAKILDFSTTSDEMVSPNVWGKESDSAISDDLGKVNIGIQQLVSPPAPIDTAHYYGESVLEPVPLVGDLATEGLSVADLVEAYKLANA